MMIVNGPLLVFSYLGFDYEQSLGNNYIVAIGEGSMKM